MTAERAKITIGDVLVKSYVAFTDLVYICPVEKCICSYTSKELEELDKVDRIMWGIQDDGKSKSEEYIAYPMCETHGVFLDAAQTMDSLIDDDTMYGVGMCG